LDLVALRSHDIQFLKAFKFDTLKWPKQFNKKGHLHDELRGQAGLLAPVNLGQMDPVVLQLDGCLDEF
jgi:hypothetical protein